MKKSIKKYLIASSAILVASSLVATVAVACTPTKRTPLVEGSEQANQSGSQNNNNNNNNGSTSNSKSSLFDFDLTKTRPSFAEKQKIYLSDKNKEIINQEIEIFKKKLAQEVDFDTKPAKLVWDPSNLPDQFKQDPRFMIDNKFLKEVKHTDIRLSTFLPFVNQGIMPLVSKIEPNEQKNLVTLLVNEKQKEDQPIYVSFNPFIIGNYLNSPLFLYDVQHGIVRDLYWFKKDQNSKQWKQATLEGFIPNKSIRLPSSELLKAPDFDPANEKVVNLVLELKNENNEKITLNLEAKPRSFIQRDNLRRYVYENPEVNFSELKGNKFTFVSLKANGNDKDLLPDQIKQNPIFVRYQKDEKVAPVLGVRLNTIIEDRHALSYIGQYITVDRVIFAQIQNRLTNNKTPFFFNKNLKEVSRSDIDNILIPYFFTNDPSLNLTLRYEVSDVDLKSQELAITAVFKDKTTNQEYRTGKIFFGFDKFENLEQEKIILNTESSLYTEPGYDENTEAGKKKIKEYLDKNKLTYENINSYEQISDIWTVIHSEFDFEKFEHPKIGLIKNDDKSITLTVSMKQRYVNGEVKTSDDFEVVKQFTINYFKNN
ncbi:Vmc-like lipoprotein signal peptide domain-containing protein [Ureaplasma diversum]|uniref:Lipoprotein n=1 Tax=Ureaplasma diversum NCTC 246 TaxID=1188241 RepID=A0A084EYB1_9BACT|nr:hypothetical protein [Ureaplasma diversum]KEZ22953.1 Hypothetical protein, predicted lipoprotein [Ureaplasma diversum NCTC 246]